MTIRYNIIVFLNINLTKKKSNGLGHHFSWEHFGILE